MGRFWCAKMGSYGGLSKRQNLPIFFKRIFLFFTLKIPLENIKQMLFCSLIIHDKNIGPALISQLGSVIKLAVKATIRNDKMMCDSINTVLHFNVIMVLYKAAVLAVVCV